MIAILSLLLLAVHRTSLPQSAGPESECHCRLMAGRVVVVWRFLAAVTGSSALSLLRVLLLDLLPPEPVQDITSFESS